MPTSMCWKRVGDGWRGARGTWWPSAPSATAASTCERRTCFDLGEELALLLSHHTLRHARNDKHDLLCSWEVQVGDDSEHWVPLASEETSSVFRRPLQIEVFTLEEAGTGFGVADHEKA